MDRTEVQKKLDEINHLDENTLIKKVEIMKEIIFSGYFETENYLTQFENGQNQKDNKLLRFLKYKDERGFFKGIDLDVCLTSIVTYCMLYDFLNEEDIHLQFRERYKYEIKSEGKTGYRGDTLTSAWTVFRKYLTFWWYETIIPEYKELFAEYKKDTLMIPHDKEASYKGFKDYVIDRGTNEKDFLNTILSVMSDEAEEFLSNYMMSGNYIVVPECFNIERSFAGEKDTADRMLWKLFQYFYYKKEKGNDAKAKECLKQMFSVKVRQGESKEEKIEKSVKNCLKWLNDSGADSWDKFIEIHCLQDFIVLCEDGKYGKPISLKIGSPIDEKSDMEYNPMPGDLEQCETFFKNANEKIKKRSERIYKKIFAQNS